MEQSQDIFKQLMTESTDFIESNWKQWTGTADTNSRTTEIFSDQYGNHFQWTHIHEADYNNYDDVDDSRDFWILGDGQGHQRQFDSPITAKQALQKINAGRAQEVFADEALLEDDTTSCLFYAPFGLYILLSILMLLLTIFLAIMCFRRRRLIQMQMEEARQRRILRSSEEAVWAQGHAQYQAEQNHDSNEDEELVKPGILDKPPSYENVTKNENTAPPKYEDIA